MGRWAGRFYANQFGTRWDLQSNVNQPQRYVSSCFHFPPCVQTDLHKPRFQSYAKHKYEISTKNKTKQNKTKQNKTYPQTCHVARIDRGASLDKQIGQSYLQLKLSALKQLRQRGLKSRSVRWKAGCTFCRIGKKKSLGRPSSSLQDVIPGKSICKQLN